MPLSPVSFLFFLAPDFPKDPGSLLEASGDALIVKVPAVGVEMGICCPVELLLDPLLFFSGHFPMFATLSSSLRLFSSRILA